MLPVQRVSLCHGSSQAIDSFKAQRLLYYIAGFNNQKFFSLTIECVSVFCMDLITNCDYFPIQHLLTGFYNRYGVFPARYERGLAIKGIAFRPYRVGFTPF